MLRCMHVYHPGAARSIESVLRPAQRPSDESAYEASLSGGMGRT